MFWKKFAASKSLPLSLWFPFNSAYSMAGHNVEGTGVFAAWGVASVEEEIWSVAFWIREALLIHKDGNDLVFKRWGVQLSSSLIHYIQDPIVGISPAKLHSLWWGWRAQRKLQITQYTDSNYLVNPKCSFMKNLPHCPFVPILMQTSERIIMNKHLGNKPRGRFIIPGCVSMSEIKIIDLVVCYLQNESKS